MGTDLAGFLAARVAAAEARMTWPTGIELIVRAYLTAEPAPLALITSVRCRVLRGTEVLVFYDAAVPHVLPSGRREPGETPEAALRRELLEETGWEVGPLSPIGFIHLRHRSPTPPGSTYPYPDFLQTVSTAAACAHHPARIVPDELVQGAGFVPVMAARSLPLPPVERAFLDAAPAVAGGTSPDQERAADGA